MYDGVKFAYPLKTVRFGHGESVRRIVVLRDGVGDGEEMQRFLEALQENVPSTLEEDQSGLRLKNE